MLAASANPAQAAAKPKTLYTFCAKSSSQCTEAGPTPAFVRDASGNFYGTTRGTDSTGAAYKLELQDRGKYVLRKMAEFCNGCVAGYDPLGQVVVDVNGALYGALEVNGPHGGGVIYKLTPAKHNKWKFSTFYAFCSLSACADGKYPSSGLSYQGMESGLPYDGVSPLYGTTQSGGAHNNGILYKLVPQGSTATQTVVHDFCAKTSCIDGGDPVTEVTLDSNGDIYGHAVFGGRWGKSKFPTDDRCGR